jgi:hypothetical protein
MTRDFDKQRRERNDARPYARNQQSGRPDGEHSAQPGRPRLNRETVDRAWENGAPSNHADYHPRNTGGNPRSGRPYGQAPRSSEQYGRSPNRRDYDNGRAPDRYDRRQNQNQNSYPRTQGPRSRSYNPRERQFEGQPYGERREYGPGPNTGYRGNRDERYNSRPPYGREDERREQGYPNRYSRPGNRQTRPPRYNDRGQRPYQNGQPYEARETRAPDRRNYRHNEQEQFEGDYEQFRSYDNHEHREHRPAPRRTEHRQPEERHVTRLPDGRVLKGPRPAQRKNARFWSEVTEDTNALLPQTPAEAEKQVELAEQPEVNLQQPDTTTTRKPRRPMGGTTARGKKAGARESRAKGSSDVPRPSQRGFKWPTP